QSNCSKGSRQFKVPDTKLFPSRSMSLSPHNTATPFPSFNRPCASSRRGPRRAMGLAQDSWLSLFDDAIRELRETLRVRSGPSQRPFVNLARALRAKGDLNGAAAELDAYLKQKPDNADAQSALAFIYSTQGRYEEALPHLREAAARLKPQDADIQ